MENQTQTNNTVIMTKNEKIMGILAYLIFFLPWILVKRRSHFLNFHINQGFILFVVSIIGKVILHSVPLFFILHPLWNLAMLLFVIIGILNVVHGRTKQLPLIGHLFDVVR